jgi:hypothetical protein
VVQTSVKIVTCETNNACAWLKFTLTFHTDILVCHCTRGVCHMTHQRFKAKSSGSMLCTHFLLSDVAKAKHELLLLLLLVVSSVLRSKCVGNSHM